MDQVPQEMRIQKLCAALLCNPCSLSLLPNQEWYVAVGSICFWAKVARIPTEYLKIKALLLSFAECYNKDKATFEPVYDLDSLHVFTQWQCVYHDAILLNQILALPLPYLLPASLFDGKRVTYYYQNEMSKFHAYLAKVSGEIRSLYEILLQAVCNNIK